MNRTDLASILEDLDDVVSRLRDAGFTTAADNINTQRNKLTPPERLSYPPSNGELRRRASEHFAKAREYTSEAVRRLRREP
jgi:hypothetical protein